MEKKIIIGKEEWCAFPELGLPAIKARVDSGAKTSSLHAFNMQIVTENGEEYVLFDIHPVQRNKVITKKCKGLLVDKRKVKSSSGNTQKRPVIQTDLKIGDKIWQIELTLTNRDSMGYRMLLGRQAMEDRVLIDPGASFCLGNIDKKELKKIKYD